MTPYDTEYRRCLISLDVPGMMALQDHHAKHLVRQTPAQTLCAMHMARVEMKYISRKLKLYSIDWLSERGIAKVDGRWEIGPRPKVISEAVGISSKSNVPGLSKRIVTAMSDALDNARAKGIIEAPVQKELMMKARQRIRFKGRHI